MNVQRIDKSADKIIDAFSDMRVTDGDLIYVAMQVVYRANPVEILHRVVEFGEQVKWEIDNNRRDRKYVQDSLFD
jgi:hypothetical protein